MNRPEISPWSQRLPFAGVLLFGLLAMTARNALDPDLWWHLRAGQWIVENGRVPHADPFSFTRAGHAWVAHEWLSEAVFYELWKHGGMAALIVFSAAVTTAGFMLLYLRCVGAGHGHGQRAQPHWAAAATALGAWAAAPSWGVRPQMFTFTLASLLLWLVERAEDRPRLLFWIPPLFLLWLNLHAGFALAPALLIAYAAGLIAETALGKTPWQEARPMVLRVLLVVGACLLLVPVNPSGTQLYRYPLQTLRSPWMRSFIVEWFSPDFHAPEYLPFLLVWLALFVAFARGRSRPSWRWMAPLLLTAGAALDAVRHIPIFALLAIPTLAAAIPSASPALPFSHQLSHQRSAASRLRLRPIFNVAVLIFLAVFALVRWVSLARGQNSREAEQYPQKAAAFLETGRYPRNLFAYYDWGGYAIWKLYPGYRVFVDGRADLYGEDLLRQFKTAVDVRRGWREILDRWKIAVVLVPAKCALAQALLLDPDWHAEFSDPQATVLLRTPAVVKNAGLPPESYPPAGSQRHNKGKE